MAIIPNAKGYTNDLYLNLFPDQYVSEKEKRSELWIKTNMDYFSNVAYKQFQSNSDSTITKNYDLVKGIITREDFYEVPEVKPFVDTLERTIDLPSYVKHYPILNPPLNTLVGEITKRPDNSRVKAMDDDSKSEELEYKSKRLQEYLYSIISNKIKLNALESGVDLEDPEALEQIEQMTYEQFVEEALNYTSAAESWGHHVLEALKVGMNLKELSEEAFRDLLICSREYFHIYEDNSSMGFSTEVLNPKEVWFLSTPNKKYTRDAYAAGFITLMELSEVLDKYKLSKVEVDHLRKGLRGFYQYGMARESNLVNPKAVGIGSVTYDTYDPLIERERNFVESQLQSNNIQLENYLGIGQNNVLNSFGTKVVVIQCYWKSKMKVGKLTYIDEDGNEQVVLVSEDYKKIPGEISITWEYVNQWWKGTKIGQDVYIDVEPLEILDYCPIIGVVHEIKNTQPRSLVDLMKPFQVLYNICMNQLYSLLEKDLGMVVLTSLRHLPKLKDQDEGDAIETWEMMAKEKGVIFVDDSPENLKAPSSFNQHTALNLSRAQEIQARYNLAAQLKLECWELVGINRERTGGIAATQTATATNAALTQSYAQTEPYFVQHEYLLNQYYQALLDVAQNIETRKPSSTISYINSIGESAFVKVSAGDLKGRDLQVFVTSRAQDQQMVHQLQGLSQVMLQNGASVYEVALLYNNGYSTRNLLKMFKDLKDKQDQRIAQEQQMQQQQMEQQQTQFEAQMAESERIREETIINENYNKEMDRINKKEVAIINTFSRQENNMVDSDESGVPDILEVSRLNMDLNQADRAHQIQLQKIAMEREKINQQRSSEISKMQLEKEKLQVVRENMKNDKEIAQINAKNRATKASSTNKKSKK